MPRSERAARPTPSARCDLVSSEVGAGGRRVPFRSGRLPQFSIQGTELKNRSDQHAGASAGLGSVLTPSVRDGDFADPKAGCFGTNEQLCIDEGPDGSQGYSFDDPAMKEFERAVDIPDAEAEESLHDASPDAGDGDTMPWVAARKAIPGHDVEIARVSQEVSDLIEVELEIGITEEDQVTFGCGEP